MKHKLGNPPVIEVLNYSTSGSKSFFIGAGQVRGKVKDYVSRAAGDVTEKEEFFRAVTYGTPLKGTSVFLCKVSNTSQGSGSIPGITKLGSFQFEVCKVGESQK